MFELKQFQKRLDLLVFHAKYSASPHSSIGRAIDL